jgi:hypothetical protein
VGAWRECPLEIGWKEEDPMHLQHWMKILFIVILLFLTQCLHHLDVNRMTHDVQEWADTIVGDTRLVKRKTRLGPSERKGKRCNSQMKSKMMKRLGIKRAQLTLVLVMVQTMTMVAMGTVEMMLEHVVDGVVQEELKWEIGDLLEKASSPMPH